MGKVLVRMLQSSGAKIFICSRSPRRARALSQRLNVGVRGMNHVQDIDVVIVSVPIERTIMTCRQLLKGMKPRSLLIDVTSVKKGIVDAIKKHVPENIEYLSLHPLFGPDTEDFREQNVLAIILRRGPLSVSMLRFLSKRGLRITHVTIDSHDRKMAVTQALHHFAYAALVTCVMKLMKKNDLQRFSTRSIRKTFELIRSLSENTDTIMEIQRMNQYSVTVRRKYAKTVASLLRMDDRAIHKITDAMKAIQGLPSTYV
jgi:prephenate dehydrogenase